MAFNYSYPILLKDLDSCANARHLLNHEKSTLGDSRLVAAVEIHQLRGEC